MRKIFGLISFMAMYNLSFVQQADSTFSQNKQLLFEDDFSQPVLGSSWIVETNEKDAPGYSMVDGRLQLETEGGLTLWFKKELTGNIIIEYDRTVVMDGGKKDRLSDVNQFWMATDPQQKMFTRKGGFREYDSLQMYYAGMGGNYNSTTRMRRYDGKGVLQIVGEYKDSAHLLQPNKTYHIMIMVKDGLSKFIVDGSAYFSYNDDQPFTRGWFGIRTTKSRQLIDNVKIWQLN